MSPPNPTILFAYKIPQPTHVGRMTHPGVAALHNERDYASVYWRSIGTSSVDGSEGMTDPLAYRSQVNEPVEFAWGEPRSERVSASFLTHIPKDDDFLMVLKSNQPTETMTFATLYWSEAEMLYMRHRAHN